MSAYTLSASVKNHRIITRKNGTLRKIGIDTHGKSKLVLGLKFIGFGILLYVLLVLLMCL